MTKNCVQPTDSTMKPVVEFATVRGTAMNATDHPLGGGRGRSKGNNVPRSPWNQPSKGFKTRTKSKIWSWMIVRDRRKTSAAA